ncbi:hypothetical protein H257_07306 [Aphanomyces astaci]|uniref:DUF7769 domain-containing protein n=1 Tax=Aphanomyces astaci TaxID=112090 RepID=W4GIV0_APHAT|nr:hypothetical protein H257_07306 [Aphanomyces astaci]ETV79241.1 hypothetical protein H257_07306 [Aphanomyces astaci]|eukprot:XP_009831082.1 hypothetical protein H257_07306 [Aphanomyces astaci]
MNDLTSDQRRAVVDHLLLRIVKGPCKLQRGAIQDVARMFGRNRQTIADIWKRANVSLGNGDLPARELVCEDVSSKKKVELGPKLTDVNKTAGVKWAMDFVHPTELRFHDMYDYVHVDEKWFNATRVKSRFYLLPGETPPHRTTQSKRFITKELWDGKIGTWHFTEIVPAAKSSRNRPAAIKAKWPTESSRSVVIQQDNARPHVSPWDAAVVSACTSDGWSMSLKCQAPNSPDLNVLDLGFFRAIQSLQQTHHSNTYQEIVDATNKTMSTRGRWNATSLPCSAVSARSSWLPATTPTRSRT